MATVTTWRRALQQHNLAAIHLATKGTAGDKDHALGDLTLNICDTESASLRGAIARLATRFNIVAIVPPMGDSAECQALSYRAALLAEELKLPGFASAAFALSANRYLARCHWQNNTLPVSTFSLIQFPSALFPAATHIGLPVRLSPIHYHLRHLCAHIQRETDAAKAYRLIAGTLQRHILSHPASLVENGEDPRTQHHIRFSWMSDMLASAEPPATSIETTLLVRNGAPQVVTCAPIAQRQRSTLPTLKQRDIATITELSMEACKALRIQNGVATCMMQRTSAQIVLDGIIPNYIDARLVAAMETCYKSTWPEIMLKTALQPA